ncbi:hypothetical protein JAAARDRAFT_193460 [Jaapia argillacea MUCL 33604]|uniref:Cytochrome P450 n=1 Tax=Jaapia argillacea MUCL 33604 TaxID=933084 RepID=A0A067PTD7_9AGAM|nr:hypothetical protein JAAARDRAFT_193460 [Jaapia argillacea MUCL 33604]
MDPPAAVALVSTGLAVAYLFTSSPAHHILNKDAPQVPPGRIGLPVVGSFPFLTSCPELTLDHWAKKYGPLYLMWLRNQFFVVVSDPVITKDLMVTNGAIFSSRKEMFIKSQTVFAGCVQHCDNKQFLFVKQRVTHALYPVGNANLETPTQLLPVAAHYPIPPSPTHEKIKQRSKLVRILILLKALIKYQTWRNAFLLVTQELDQLYHQLNIVSTDLIALHTQINNIIERIHQQAEEIDPYALSAYQQHPLPTDTHTPTFLELVQYNSSVQNRIHFDSSNRLFYYNRAPFVVQRDRKVAQFGKPFQFPFNPDLPNLQEYIRLHPEVLPQTPTTPETAGSPPPTSPVPLSVISPLLLLVSSSTQPLWANPHQRISRGGTPRPKPPSRQPSQQSIHSNQGLQELREVVSRSASRTSYQAPEESDNDHSTTEEEAETQPAPITEEPEDSHSPTQDPPTGETNPEEPAPIPVDTEPPPDPPNHPVPTSIPQPQVPPVPPPPPPPPGPTHSSTMSGTANKGPKLAPPSVFTGDRLQTDKFIQEVKLNIGANPDNFKNKWAKITYTLSS